MFFKKIFLVSILIVSYFVSNGQFINIQTVSNKTSLYKSFGGLGSDSGFIITNTGDTTFGRQVNFYDGIGGKGFGLLGYNGFLYYRYNGAWVKIASSGIIPAQFNPSAGWGIVLSGTYPNITFTVDSIVVASKNELQKKVDSLGVVKLNTGDTIHLSDRINARVLYTDSNTVYLTPYGISQNYYNKTLSDARYVQITRNINTTAPILGGGNLSTDLTIHADTGRVGTQLATGGGLNKVKDSVVALISSMGGGTVLNVSTTNGAAIISSVATASTTPNITISVDTNKIHTWVYDSVNFYPLNSNPNRYWDSVRAKAWSNATFAPISVVNFDTTVLNLTTRFGYKKGWGDYSASGYGFTYNNLTGAFTFDSSKYITWLDTTGIIATKHNLASYQPIGSYVPTSTTLTINGTTFDLSTSRTWNVGTVTSVGLLLPSMFTVSGSPVTSSGSLSVTLANQNANLVFASPTSGSPAQPTFRSLIAADIPLLPQTNIIGMQDSLNAKQRVITAGTNLSFSHDTLNAAIGSGSGSSTPYYFNGGTAASLAGYYQMSQSAVAGTTSNFTLTGNGLIAQFITDSLQPYETIIPAGVWNFNVYLSMSNNSFPPQIYAIIYKYNSGIYTPLDTSATIGISNGTTKFLYNFSALFAQTTLSVTDRIAIRFYITGSGGSNTATLYTQDNNPSYVATSFARGISSLNGLTKPTQYFVTDTTSSNTSITSSVDTHTFHIPIGLLTANINLKANDNAVVHLAGSEVITGTKSFNPSTLFISSANGGGIGHLLVSRGTAYSSAVLQNKGYTLADSADVTNGLALKKNNNDSIGAQGYSSNGHLYKVNDSMKIVNAATYVPQTTTVNGHALNSNITISASDITTGTLPNAQLSTSVTLQGNTFNGANQLLQLDAGGKVAFSNLPASLYIYKGTWDASTNTPTLANGTGTSGWVYQSTTAGTVNFGAGNITFSIGDYVGYNGSIWQWSPGTSSVRSVSVNGSTAQQGIVSITLPNTSVTNAMLANSTITINSTAISLGGSMTGIIVAADTSVFSRSNKFETLTNKTISGSGNTITNIANSSLTNSSVTINGNAVSLGGSTTVTANTPNAIVFNNSGIGHASGTSFNGSAADTISYNTIGAQPLATNLTSLAGLSWVSGAYFVKMTAAGTFSLDNSTYLTSSTGVTTFSGGTTGLTPVTATSGAITLAGTLAVANGGTGATTASGARANLGLAIGTDVLAYNANVAYTNVANTFTSNQTFNGNINISTTTKIVGNNDAVNYYINDPGTAILTIHWFGGITLATSGNVSIPSLSTAGVLINNTSGVISSTTAPTISGANITAGSISGSSLATAYLQLTGGTLTGALSGTSASFSTTLGVTGQLTLGSTITNGTYTYSLPNATGTLALTSQLPTVNDATLTLNVSGSGLSGSQTFTANQSTGATFTVTSNATTAATANTIAYRDASGDLYAHGGRFDLLIGVKGSGSDYSFLYQNPAHASISDVFYFPRYTTDTLVSQQDLIPYLKNAVTSITAGTGLSGGTITSTGTIAVDTSVISTKWNVSNSNAVTGYYNPAVHVDSLNCTMISIDSLVYIIHGTSQIGEVSVSGKIRLNMSGVGSYYYVFGLPSYISTNAVISHGGGAANPAANASASGVIRVSGISNNKLNIAGYAVSALTNEDMYFSATFSYYVP